MAIIIGQPAGGSLSGKLGGAVYSRNRYGLYSKAYAKPVMPNTILQQAVRSSLGIVATAWRGLDQSSRDNWNRWAATFKIQTRSGTPISPSGFNAFIMANIPRIQVGEQMGMDGPYEDGLLPPEPEMVISAVGNDTFSLAFTGDWKGDNSMFLDVYMSPIVAASRSYIPRVWRRVGTIDGSTVPAVSPHVFTNIPFGNGGNGGKYMVKAIVRGPNGNFSPEVVATAVSS
jgi:hypothetical protein